MSAKCEACESPTDLCNYHLRIREHAERALVDAPPVSDEQKARIARLLTNGSPS